MSLKDLCTIDILPELIDAGIDSFKIEGRMKQPEYVYTVVKMYRKNPRIMYQRQTKESYLQLIRDVVIVKATIISITARTWYL